MENNVYHNDLITSFDSCRYFLRWRESYHDTDDDIGPVAKSRREICFDLLSNCVTLKEKAYCYHASQIDYRLHYSELGVCMLFLSVIDFYAWHLPNIEIEHFQIANKTTAVSFHRCQWFVWMATGVTVSPHKVIKHPGNPASGLWLIQI